MKLSQFIKQLQEFQNKNGDVNVAIYNDEGWTDCHSFVSNVYLENWIPNQDNPNQEKFIMIRTNN